MPGACPKSSEVCRFGAGAEAQFSRPAGSRQVSSGESSTSRRPLFRYQTRSLPPPPPHQGPQEPPCAAPRDGGLAAAATSNSPTEWRAGTRVGEGSYCFPGTAATLQRRPRSEPRQERWDGGGVESGEGGEKGNAQAPRSRRPTARRELKSSVEKNWPKAEKANYRSQDGSRTTPVSRGP